MCLPLLHKQPTNHKLLSCIDCCVTVNQAYIIFVYVHYCNIFISLYISTLPNCNTNFAPEHINGGLLFPSLFFTSYPALALFHVIVSMFKVLQHLTRP